MYVEREFELNQYFGSPLLGYLQEKNPQENNMRFCLFYFNFPMESVGQVTSLERFAIPFFVAFMTVVSSIS